MKLFYLVFTLLLTQQLAAQSRCAAPVLNVSGMDAVQGIREGAPALGGIQGAAAAGMIRIPVVVHVLYQNNSHNLSDEQVRSGIEALNRDFRRRNADTVNTPARFLGIAADMEIEFVLATADPEGRATSGIVRKQTTVAEWAADDRMKYSSKGGSDAWDTKSYLNIWVGNMPRSLGFASTPGSDAKVDGIVITTKAYGTLGRTGAYNMGRTLVHEVGHWLGLKHIWGDAACGDDGVGDTPKQAGFTSGCPTGTFSTCGNNPAGDMYMNFMDFTNDACMNLFTQGQKARARQVFAPGRERAAIVESKGLAKPWNFAAVATPFVKAEPKAGLQLYPNPAGSSVQVTLPQSYLNAQVQVLSLSGKVLQRSRITAIPHQLNLAGLSPGIYLLTATNGTELLSSKLVRTASFQ